MNKIKKTSEKKSFRKSDLSKKICIRDKKEATELDTIQTILSNILYGDVISVICTYLLLLCEHMKFFPTIQELLIYQNNICLLVNLSTHCTRTIYYHLDTHMFLKKLKVPYRCNNNGMLKILQNTEKSEKLYRFYREGTEKGKYIFTFFISRNNRKGLLKRSEFPEQREMLKLACSQYPLQIYFYETNEKKIKIFYFAYVLDEICPLSVSHLYYFDKEKITEEHKLPFAPRSNLCWCIWNHFILFLPLSEERICSFDILTGRMEDSFDFRGLQSSKFIISPIKIIRSWKNKLYLVDKENNLYIYS